MVNLTFCFEPPTTPLYTQLLCFLLSSRHYTRRPVLYAFVDDLDVCIWTSPRLMQIITIRNGNHCALSLNPLQLRVSRICLVLPGLDLAFLHDVVNHRPLSSHALINHGQQHPLRAPFLCRKSLFSSHVVLL